MAMLAKIAWAVGVVQGSGVYGVICHGFGTALLGFEKSSNVALQASTFRLFLLEAMPHPVFKPRGGRGRSVFVMKLGVSHRSLDWVKILGDQG